MTFQRLLLKLHARGLLTGAAGRYLARRTWTIEAGEARGLKFSLPQNLEFILGSSERPMQRCIAEHLASGGVFYDVGANVGFFSLLAARRIGPAGAVYSFEPVAENVAAIERNVRLNALTNVSVFQVAVDASSRTGELVVTEWDGGASLATTGTSPGGARERRTVRVAALDDLMATEGLRPPTLVKIDVEGAELGALNGMVNLLRTFRPALVYEVDDGDRASFERRWKALDDFVTALGYRVSHLDNSYPGLNWNVGHSIAVAA